MYLNNHCRFTGNLVKTPELHHTGDHVPVTTFILAVKRERPDANGQWPADFITFVAWRNKAEKIAANYKKGDLIEVIGRLQTHSSTDKNGTRHMNAEITVFESRRAPLSRPVHSKDEDPLS